MAAVAGAGYGPAGGADKARPGPYPTGPLQAGPLTPGAVKPAEDAPAAAPAAEAAPAAAAPAAPAAAVPAATPIQFFSPELEKSNLVKKLRQQQQTDNNCKAKWWSFCKVHGEGNFEASKFDSAFLLTFFEALEAGDIPDEPGNPYLNQGGGQGWGGAGGWDGAGQGAANSGDPNKIFVGGLPKTTTEADVWKHFGWYGTVTQVSLKYDPEGGFRGFGFVTFQDANGAQKVLADNDGNGTFQGKSISAKLATGTPAGKGKGDKGGFDKGKGGKGYDKGGFDKGKGKKGDGKWGGGDWGGGFGGSKGSKDGGKPKGGGPGASDDAKVFVGALPKSTTQDAVWNFMSQFGEVRGVDLKFDENGTPRGFAFITFASPESVQAAIANASNNYMEGKWVDVRPASAKGGGKGGKDGGKGDKGKGGKDFGKGKGKDFGKGDKGGWGMGGGGWGW